MTPEAREASQSDPGGAAPHARVIVVGADDARMLQYKAALTTARLPFRALFDPADAVALISAEPPEVLVLDLGLPRLAMLQLYGAARSAEPGAGGEAVQVLFVGQDSDTGPDDHYLSGEPSPVMVASWVSDLLAGPEEPPVLDLGVTSALPTDVHEPVSYDDTPGETLADADAGMARSTDDASSAVPTTAIAADAAGEARDIAETAPAADGEAIAAASSVEPETAAKPAQTESSLSSSVLDEADSEPASVPGPVPAQTAPAPTEAAPDAAPSRRSYLTLVRIGLVLFILGLLLFLVRLEWSGPAITPPPTVAPPATPAGLHPAPLPMGRVVSVPAV